MRYPLAVPVLALALVCGACANPPDKEMNQARGAIQAARAAGADLYAPEEYKAAVTAIERSEAAVAQRDFRQALNSALESREQAENAARAAADRKAVARGDAERELAKAATLVEQALARLKAADAVPTRRRPPLTAELQTIANAQASVQKARTAVADGNFLAARESLRGVGEAVQQAITQIDKPIPPPPPRRRR